MLLWRISSTVVPLTRSWLAAICTLAWTWWSSSTASVDSTSDRQRGQMAERRRRRDQHVAAEHLVQQRLELEVLRRAADRTARGRELRPITRDGVDHRVAHARVELQPEIAAGTEVDVRAPLSETVRPSSTWSSGVDAGAGPCSRPSVITSSRIARRSSAVGTSVPPGFDGSRPRRHPGQCLKRLLCELVRLKTWAVPSEITGQGVPSSSHQAPADPVRALSPAVPRAGADRRGSAAAAIAAAQRATVAGARRRRALSLGLAAYWVYGYRRGRFSLALEPLEADAVFVILHVTPGNPLLPLLGLVLPQPLRRSARSPSPATACGWPRCSAPTPTAARAAARRSLARHGHRARADPRPVAVGRPARVGDHPAPADVDRPELDRRRHDRRRGPARSAGRPPRSAACSARTRTRSSAAACTTSSTPTTAPRSTATSPRPRAAPTTPAT